MRAEGGGIQQIGIKHSLVWILLNLAELDKGGEDVYPPNVDNLQFFWEPFPDEIFPVPSLFPAPTLGYKLITFPIIPII